MTTSRVSRRCLLATAAAAGAFGGSLGPSLRAARADAPEAASLTVDRRAIEVNGKPASVFGIQREGGAPGLVLDPGERFKLTLQNKAGEQTIVHWHGQTPPPNQDGVVETGFASLIDAGGSQGYDFAARPGTHWMHSHHGLQEQLLMAAPLIVRSADDLRADAQEVVVILHDFTFRDPAEVLAGLTGQASSAQVGMMSGAGGGMGGPGMSGMSMSGMGMGGMNMGGASMGGMTMGNQAMPTSGGGMMDLNDVYYDAYLANDRTLEDPLVVRTERSGRVHLRLINGATTTAFWIDLGSLSGTVTAVDGDPVRPVRGSQFPLAQGQRIDLVLDMPASGGSFPVLAQREGDRQRTGIIIASPGAAIVKVPGLADSRMPPADLSLEQRLSALSPLPRRQPDVTHRVALTGSMRPYAWEINGRSWADHQPLRVAKGQRIAIEMVNRSMMAHPMHLHGHHFQVVSLNGRPLAGAMRDTVLVPMHGAVTVAFDADNPGRWLFHCHNLFHMATGMMTEVAYDNAA